MCREAGYDPLLSLSTWAGGVTYLAIKFTAIPQPCRLALKAFARRASGIRSKPDFVTVSMTASVTSSTLKQQG
jgi:hypothetical protein